MIYGLLPLLFDKMRGKSTCFMIAMFLNFIIMFLNFIITAQPGSIVVCVSPLIAIMKEQAARFSALGISAEFVGEDQTDPRVKSRVLRGNVQLLFISPENLLCNWVYRNMLLTDQYKKSLVCVAVDEAHCVKTWGDKFRTAFAQIGEVRCLIPSSVNVMALTATSTIETFQVVLQRLSLFNPVTVAVSPNRGNIKLLVQPSKSLKEFGATIVQELKAKRKRYPKTVIFTRSYLDCTNLFLTMACSLRKDITFPAGYPNLLKYRLITMYTRATTDEMKSKIMASFTQESSTLRIVIATTSFSMGIDIPDIRQIIHWGPPTDIEQYVQEIGRAGRDGKESLAILMFEKANRFTKQAMRICAECKTECRRKNLFGNFIQYIHNTDPHCKCCDICDMICDCTICTSISF
ncbi:ATP-dependent DNA helicase RecQ-like isoform X1 [Dysidea avara]|uniref:ATP-dependent DNA helicase RecQ-like isoform X1 n=1 Tax=Dysidea avara TaxID=196820 RepID=UPI00332547D0